MVITGRKVNTLKIMSSLRTVSLAAALFAPVVLGAQGTGRPQPPAPPAGAMAAANAGMNDQVAMAVEQSMSAHMDGPHLDLTPRRKPSPGDSIRAARVAAELRRGIEKYKDVSVAVSEGFRMFAPQATEQPVYHYIHAIRTMREAARFEPGEPSSLIYRKRADGSLELYGAMYTAGVRATLDELNSRIPLSVARWHRHVNYCFPTQRRRIAETRDGKPLFGPVGILSTRAECEAAGGEFTRQLFGWMVHANVYAGTDPKAIWGADHAHGHPPH